MTVSAPPRPVPEADVTGRHRVVFRAGHQVIAVETPGGSVRELVASLLPAFLSTAADSPTMTMRLCPSESGWTISAHEDVDHFPTYAHALDTLEHRITEALLRGLTDFVHVHAAGAVHNDTATLVLGASGAGKSSLALHWCVTGHRVLGDDIVLLDDACNVRPFQRLFSVTRERLHAYQIAPPSHLDAIADDDKTWYDPIQHSGWASATPVSRVVIARYRPGAFVKIGSMSRMETLSSLLASVMPTGRVQETAFDLLAGVAANAEGMSITFGDAGAAGDALLRS